MSARARALLALGAASLLVVAGALVERTHAGVERCYFAFLILLVAPLYRLLLVALGRIEMPPAFVLGCAAFGFTGVAAYPFGAWGLIAGGIAAFWLALPIAEREAEASVRASWLEEALVALLVGVAAVALTHTHQQFRNYALAFTLAVLAIETWGPRAERTVAAAARRVATLPLVVATAALTGEVYALPRWSVVDPRGVLAFLGATAVLTACAEVARQPKPAPGSPPSGGP